MNKIIQELCIIEERAGQIIKNTENQKEEILEKKNQKEKFIVLELQEEIERRLENLKSELEESSEKEIKHAVKKTETLIAELNKTYDGNYEELAREILERIIEV